MIQQAAEQRIGIESWDAQPRHAAVPADQRNGRPVPDQPEILQRKVTRVPSDRTKFRVELEHVVNSALSGHMRRHVRSRRHTTRPSMRPSCRRASDQVSVRPQEEATMTNKLLLAAIAFGLWVNIASWLVRPARAQSDQLAGSVQQIAEELRQLVEHGDKCLNPQLCQSPRFKRHPR